MNYFSYKIEHDYGLAPNPFGQYCTLAVCKPSIRKNKILKIGDWVFGTGSKQLHKLHHLIFAMEIKGKMTFDEYWDDSRFQYKKPILNGSLVQMYGDNFYHRDKNGEWMQEDSAHSIIDSKMHLKNDTGGKYILFSDNFYYFGDHSPLIPEEFWNICSEGRNMKSNSIDKNIAAAFVKWLKMNFERGIHGDPINWKEYAE